MIEEIEKNAIGWANERGIGHSSNRRNQALKMVEEVGELCRAILKNDEPNVYDGIGDVMVTLAILAHQYDTSLGECFDLAWNEIKDRTGRTLDGTFIKRSDL